MDKPECTELDFLRSIVQDSLGKHLYDNAIFFADKLVTLSEAAPDDVYRLAQAFLFTKQYRRALNLLQKTKHATSSSRFRYLTAKCLEKCTEWDECLATLDDDALQDAQVSHAPIRLLVRMVDNPPSTPQHLPFRWRNLQREAARRAVSAYCPPCCSSRARYTSLWRTGLWLRKVTLRHCERSLSTMRRSSGSSQTIC